MQNFFFSFYFYVFSVQDFTDVFQVYPDNHWFFFLFALLLRPNEKINVFRVTGLNTYNFLFNYFFYSGFFFLCILKGISPFKMHKI